MCDSKEMGKGIYHQIDEVNDYDKLPSKEEFIDMIDEVYEILSRQYEKSPVRYDALISCKTRGVVMIDLANFEPCIDSECGICSSFREVIQKEFIKPVEEVKTLRMMPKKEVSRFQHKSKYHK